MGGRGGWGIGWEHVQAGTKHVPHTYNKNSSHAVDAGDAEAGEEAGAVVRLGDVPPEGVLEAGGAVVRALCWIRVARWVVGGETVLLDSCGAMGGVCVLAHGCVHPSIQPV